MTDCYYKVRQVLQSVIDCCYKSRQVLQTLREKCPNKEYFGPYFPVFGRNTEIYGVNFRIQFEYGKIRTKKYSVFGDFSRSESVTDFIIKCDSYYKVRRNTIYTSI